MLHRFTGKYVPMPSALRAAVVAQDVALSIMRDGSVAYVIRPNCPNRQAVVAAIETRTRWRCEPLSPTASRSWLHWWG